MSIGLRDIFVVTGFATSARGPKRRKIFFVDCSSTTNRSSPSTAENATRPEPETRNRQESSTSLTIFSGRCVFPLVIAVVIGDFAHFSTQRSIRRTGQVLILQPVDLGSAGILRLKLELAISRLPPRRVVRWPPSKRQFSRLPRLMVVGVNQDFHCLQLYSRFASRAAGSESPGLAPTTHQPRKTGFLPLRWRPADDTSRWKPRNGKFKFEPQDTGRAEIDWLVGACPVRRIHHCAPKSAKSTDNDSCDQKEIVVR